MDCGNRVSFAAIGKDAGSQFPGVDFFAEGENLGTLSWKSPDRQSFGFLQMLGVTNADPEVSRNLLPGDELQVPGYRFLSHALVCGTAGSNK